MVRGSASREAEGEGVGPIQGTGTIAAVRGRSGRGDSVPAMPEKHENLPCGFGGGVSGT